MERFAGKHVIVTGGTAGIGFGIAKRFVAEAARVTVMGRDRERGAQAEEALGQGARYIPCDVTNEAQIREAIDRACETEPLDVLVNNAGVGFYKSTVTSEDGPAARWDFYRKANLDSAYLMSAHALPFLEKSQGAVIVNISSTAAIQGDWGLYGAAKAGVEGLTRALAAEGAPLGIRVNAVSPGWIATSPEQERAVSGGQGWEMPPSMMNRMGTPAEIAGVVTFLASKEASFVTGQTLIVDGGMTLIDYPSASLLKEVAPRGQSRG